jgi:hypothetical protein
VATVEILQNSAEHTGKHHATAMEPVLVEEIDRDNLVDVGGGYGSQLRLPWRYRNNAK